MEEIQIRVYGRVHGVNLREIVRARARENGLKGFVLNRADGNVEIVAQGLREKLEEFLTWIQGSPGFSLVKGLNYYWKKPSQKFKDFDIIKEESFFIDQAKSFINLWKYFFKEDLGKIPEHVAIIPDGNRRWAKEKKASPEFGHYTSSSFQHVSGLFDEARKIGIKYLTLWGFSTENWKRNSFEVKAIFSMILKNIKDFREEVHAKKIRFRHLGRKDRIPRNLLKELEKLERESKEYENFNVQLCLDYGGKDELLRAVNAILRKGFKKIDEEDFTHYLDSYGIPDVDLIIRTSGEMRLSGFMPFQSTYAELYFADVHFPDFNAKELRKAIKEFGRRHRRFGGS
ncbi:MAG: polyprenyl diphosphate synthase [Nanoarchaeota archaeon]